ncbi:outer membrane protein [Azospirillum sp. ST 5-10]|uniref:outer membrane protein n=1 Tax=unclassified Azospirillum TaxID=2630922 RepID=UPI003F49F989
MKHILPITAVLAAATLSHAAAQTPQSVTATFGDAYVGLSAGVLIPTDTDQTLTGAFAGAPVSGSGKLSYKPGVLVDLRAGYHFNPYLAAEADIAYSRYTYDSFDGTLTAGGFAVSGTKFDGHVTNWLGFVNAIVTPLGRKGFSPYVGAGIGASAYEAKVDSATVSNIGSFTVDSKTTNVDFAANAMVGFDYAVSDAVSVGARYRFIWTDSATTESSGGLTTESGNVRHHALSLTATYRF